MDKKRTLSRRRFMKASGVAAAAVFMAACAPAAPPQAPAEEKAEAPPPAAKEPITLRYRSWHSPEASVGDKAWYEWLSENYAQEAPDVTLKFEFVPFGSEYIQKVLADYAAGTPPDLLHSSIIWARDFYDRGVLLDLDDYLDAVPELAPDQFYGEATNRYRSKNGKYYGVPWEGPDSSIIAINSKLAQEVGLDPHGEDIKTWDDFVEAAKALTKREGGEIVQAGFLVTSMRYIEPFASWMYSNGGALHDDAITQPTFNNERGKQVLQLQLDLLNKHQVSFPISPERQDTQLFLQGKAGMIYAGTWSTTHFEGIAPEGFEYWFMLFPQGPMGDGPSTTTWSNMFVLPKKTKYPDRAFDLMRYCTTPPVVIKRFELSTRTTPLKAIFESEAWQQLLKKYPQLEVKIPAAEAGGVYPYFPFFTEANDALGTELERVILGEKDIEEALAEGEKKVQEVIQRRQKELEKS